MSQSKLSRLELARLTPSETDVVAVCDALGVDPLDVQELREHARRLRRRTVVGSVDFSRLLDEMESLYASATTIRQVQATTLPGTLQTSAYARRMAGFVAETAAAIQSDDVINQTVITRLRRHAELLNPSKQFSFLLAEFALQARWDDPMIMQQQYLHLLEMMDVPTVRISIVPTCKLPPYPLHNFVVIDDQKVLAETHTRLTLIESRDEVASYIALFETLRSLASHGDDAAVIIQSYLGTPGYVSNRMRAN